MAVVARDRFGLLGANQLRDPGVVGFAITPHDTNELEEVTRWVLVGGAGALKVKMASGRTVTLAACPAGMHPLRVSQVYATGTAATNIAGFY